MDIPWYTGTEMQEILRQITFALLIHADSDK